MLQNGEITPWHELQKSQEESLFKSKKGSELISESRKGQSIRQSNSIRVPRVASLSHGFQAKEKQKLMQQNDEKQKNQREIWRNEYRSRQTPYPYEKGKQNGRLLQKSSMKRDQLSKMSSHPVIKRSLGTSYIRNRIKQIVETNKRQNLRKIGSLKDINASRATFEKIWKPPQAHQMNIQFGERQTNEIKVENRKFIIRKEKKHFLDKILDRYS